MEVFKTNLSSYISKYTGYTRVLRLSFILEHFSDFKVEAAKILCSDLKNSMNIALYVKVCNSLNYLADPEFVLDEDWIHLVEKKVVSHIEQLESDLSTAKSTMVKESIRIGHNDLGHFQYKIGNLNEALKCYLRTRDYSTIARHNNEMCLNIISLSIDLNQFFNASNFLNKVVDDGGDPVTASKFKAAAGVVLLHDGLFRAAALKFLEVDPELGNQFCSTVSDEDIGLYGTLCALATFTRQELRGAFVEKKTFLNNYTALLPELKTLALGFIHGKYDSLLAQLEALRPRLAVDLHLARHAGALISHIADRLLVQYFAPYEAVNLSRMAAALGMEPAQLETAVAALISSDKLPARIDSQAGTLRRIDADSRESMVEKVLSLTRSHAAAVKRDILRLSLLQHDLVVEAAEGSARGGGRAGIRDSGPASAAEQDELETALALSMEQQQQPQIASGGAGVLDSLATNVFGFFGGGRGDFQQQSRMEVEREEEEAPFHAGEYFGDQDDREDMDEDEDMDEGNVGGMSDCRRGNGDDDSL